jgi:hypothetical protein
MLPVTEQYFSKPKRTSSSEQSTNLVGSTPPCRSAHRSTVFDNPCNSHLSRTNSSTRSLFDSQCSSPRSARSRGGQVYNYIRIWEFVQ